MKLIQYIPLFGFPLKAMDSEHISSKKPRPTLTLTLSLPLPQTPRIISRSRSSSIESFVKNTLSNPKSPKKLNRKQTIALLETPNTYGNTYLINAVRDNNTIKITELLTHRDLDVNHKNEWGNTALHCAAMKNNKEAINLLLQDFRTDASITNEQGLRARDCFIVKEGNEEDENIRIALFLRAMLNIAVHKESLTTLVGGSLHEMDIKNTVENIKENIAENYKHQESYQALPTDHHQDTSKSNDNKEIPEENYLPHYATDEFIQNMILMIIDNTI